MVNVPVAENRENRPVGQAPGIGRKARLVDRHIKQQRLILPDYQIGIGCGSAGFQGASVAVRPTDIRGESEISPLPPVHEKA